MIYKHKLYNSEVTLLFDELKHEYSDGQGRVMSVTQINDIVSKPGLPNWAARMASEHFAENVIAGQSYDELQLKTISKEAVIMHNTKRNLSAEFGLRIHKWVEDYINGKKPPIPHIKEEQNCVQAFLRWEKDHKVKFLQAEQVVYSRKHRYAGTMDFPCFVESGPHPGLYLGDLKTSKSIKPSHWVQTASYRFARQEEFPEENYQGQLIIRVGRDGSYEYVVNRDEVLYKKMVISFLLAQKLTSTMDLINAFKPENQ